MARHNVEKPLPSGTRAAKKSHTPAHVNISNTGVASTTAREILQTSNARDQLRAGRKIAEDFKIIKDE